MRVQFLGWEDPLEEETQPTPVFLPGKFHRGAWGATVLEVTESKMTEHTYTHTHTNTHTHIPLLSLTTPAFQFTTWGRGYWFHFPDKVSEAQREQVCLGSASHKE